MDLSAPETEPIYHPLSTLVYAASRHQVSDEWVAGRRLLADRQLTTLDVAEIVQRARGGQSGGFSAAGAYVVRLTANDSALNGTDEVTITVNPAGDNGGLPPDPGTVAPTVDPTVATTTYAATEFLYTGANPIQTGVAPGTIDPVRTAVLRGRVLDKNNAPFHGVYLADERIG